MHELEHTAEHIFVRALQNLGKDLLVRKVEHGKVSKAYIESNELTLDDIYKAEVVANEIIDDARSIKEHTFNSLDEAKSKFPMLRAYEERIKDKVRVIEVEGYDYAACIKDHVKNTSECQFFIVKHVSREKNMYTIEFLAGRDAKKQALEHSIRLLKIIDSLKVSSKTLEATIENMKRRLEDYKRALAIVSKDMLNNIKEDAIDSIRLYHARFRMLDDKAIMDKADELKDDAIVLIINNKGDRSNVVLASTIIDCRVLREALLKHGGKGGGKEEFATGSLPSINEEAFVADLDAMIKAQIYKQ